MDSSFIKKANDIFEKINAKLSGKYKGKIIAIDAESGNYYIGDSELEAYEEARKQHPKRQFVFKRVGFSSTYFVGAKR